MAELQRFWTSALPRVYGKRFVSVPAASVIPWRPGRSATICGEFTSSAELADIVRDNAVGGICDDGRKGFIAWDARPSGDILGLAKQHGSAAFAAVIAHEFGHVVQGELGYLNRTRTIFAEQQADCFAGAFFSRKLEGGGIRLGQGDFLSPAVIALLTVRDPVGTDPNDEDAHGSGFDRLRAFQDGLTDGVKGCKAYAKRLPKLFATPFQKGDGGTFPLGELLPSLTRDLNRHFTALDPAFPPLKLQVGTPDEGCSTAVTGIAACPARGVVVTAPGLLRSVHRQVGDGAVAALLAMGWSETRAMRNTATPPSDRAAYDACRAGAWFRDVAGIPASADGLQLSSGDVDEALQLLLRTSARSATSENATNSFLIRALSFRLGVTEPRGECLGTLAPSSQFAAHPPPAAGR